MSSRPATLVTIAFSHFCEKGRWALDRGAIPYREEEHAPMVHLDRRLLDGRRSLVGDRFTARAPGTHRLRSRSTVR